MKQENIQTDTNKPIVGKPVEERSLTPEQILEKDKQDQKEGELKS